MNSQFWDIEVKFDEHNKKLSIPKYHQQPIQCITFLYKDQYHTITYTPPKNVLITISSYIDSKVILNFVQSEKELIDTFFNYINDFSIDILLGWYSNFYDLPYVIYRAIDNGVDLSKVVKIPLKIYKDKSKYHINTKFYSIELNQLAKKYGDDFQSMKLKDVAKYVGWEKKEINLSEDFNRNRQKYIEYNINDVYLLKLIDNRYRLLSILLNSHIPLAFFT